MSNILGLCQYYMPIFEETFSKHNLPDELKYMAIIESALNPTAVSRAGAKGMWQFMTKTAKSYGLEINSYVDERLDPFKSSEAAAKYLEDSYKLFGDCHVRDKVQQGIWPDSQQHPDARPGGHVRNPQKPSFPADQRPGGDLRRGA